MLHAAPAAPMPMDNGRDLAEMLCTAYESDASVDDPNEHYDFSASNGPACTALTALDQIYL